MLLSENKKISARPFLLHNGNGVTQLQLKFFILDQLKINFWKWLKTIHLFEFVEMGTKISFNRPVYCIIAFNFR